MPLLTYDKTHMLTDRQTERQTVGVQRLTRTPRDGRIITLLRSVIRRRLLLFVVVDLGQNSRYQVSPVIYITPVTRIMSGK